MILKEAKTNDIYLMIAAVGFLIDKMEDLKGTPFYVHSIKQKGNLFKNELLKLEKRITHPPEHIKVKNESEAMEQLFNSYQYFEGWLNLLFEIDESHVEAFNSEIMHIVKKYKDFKTFKNGL